jgi:hypothetical protein
MTGQRDLNVPRGTWQIRLENERKVENLMRKWDGDTMARILILIYGRYDGKND